jgi:Tfp pilus assembly protein PilF
MKRVDTSLAGRLLRSLAVAVVLALGITGCSGDDSSPEDSSSSSADKKKAQSALEKGLAAHSEGDLTAAATQYDKVLELDPGNKFAYYNLALIDEASKNYGEAEKHYRAAIKTDPAYQPALYNLAILRTSQDPEEAISLYRAAVKAKPKDAASWLNLGLLLRASGDEAAGDKAVTKALELNPDLVDPAER